MTEAQILARFLKLPLDPYFPSRVTVMQNDGNVNNSGRPSGTKVTLGWATEAIPARVAPMILQRPSTPEAKGAAFVSTDNTFHCILRGHFPQITSDMFAKVWIFAAGEGTAKMFRIGSIDEPGNAIYTRLRLELIEA